MNEDIKFNTSPYIYLVIGVTIVNLSTTMLNIHLKNNLLLGDSLVSFTMLSFVLVRGYISGLVGKRLNINNIYKYSLIFFVLFGISSYLFYSGETVTQVIIYSILRGSATGVFFCVAYTAISFRTPKGEKIKGLSKAYIYSAITSIIICYISGVIGDKCGIRSNFLISCYVSIICLLVGLIIVKITNNNHNNYEVYQIKNTKPKIRIRFKDLNIKQKKKV